MNYNLLEKETDYMSKKELRIVVGADFVPTESNRYLFEKGDTEKLFGKELDEILLNSDLNMFNLEVPITPSSDELKKEGGPNLRTYPEITHILTQMKCVLLSGANNHIYDFKQKGIEDTLTCLEQSGIEYVGVGRNIQDAKKTWYKEYYGMTIGVYSCSENEFCCASDSHGGGNGYDPLETFDEIRNAKGQCDYLIVLYHGGRENYRYPSIGLKKICTKMSSCGADLVVCQHSHCIGTYEYVNNSLIVYGQGNVIFDYNDVEEWKKSILLELIFKSGKFACNAIPIEKCGEKVILSSDADGAEVISQLEKRSLKINDIDFLRKTYYDFSDKQKNILLLRGVMGINSKPILIINKLLKGRVLTWMMNSRHKRLLANYMRCESIREALLDLLDAEK